LVLNEHLYGFRYLGRLDYVGSDNERPRNFTFHLNSDGAGIFQAQLEIDNLQAEEGYKEGAASQGLVNRYERNPRLRAAAIRIHGTTCQACGFSFDSTYGSRRRGFIEVHHKRSLSTYAGEIIVDPGMDMSVLCANCHRMVHRDRDKPLGVEDLRSILESRSNTLGKRAFSERGV
jgi:5-methylcytosine-specific restriction protein A